MSLPSFLIYMAVGTGLWMTLLACSGFLLGKNFSRIEKYLAPVSYVVPGGVVIAYVARVYRCGKQNG